MALFTFVFSCSTLPSIPENPAFPFNDSLKLKVVESLILPLDEESDIFSTSVQYRVSGSSEKIYYLNEYNNSIYEYHLTENVTRKHSFDIEGPRGVGKLDGFWFINDSMLYVISSHQYLLNKILLKKSDNYQNKPFRMLIGDKGPQTSLPVAKSNNGFIVSHDKLFVTAIPDRNFGSSNFYSGAYNLISLDTSQEQIKYYNTYPKPLMGRILPPQYAYSFITQAEEDNTIIVASAFSDSIAVYSNEMQLIRNSYAGSIYKKDITQYEGNYFIQERQLFFYKNTSYDFLYYDKWRNLFYRMAEHPNTEALNNNETDRLSSKSLSIIILDRALNKVGETKLPKYTYMPMMSFVGRKGLYIAKPSIKNIIEIQEDEVAFDIFQIEPK
jgi:hypothetical protein